MQQIINNKYEINEVLGNGKFGTVYKGININNGNIVAIKTEKETPYKMLKHESTIINYLFHNKCKKIPTIYWFGLHSDNIHNINLTCLVMTFYSSSLQQYILQKGQMDIYKMSSVMIKCIDILEHIHKYFVIHRDIKPENLMVKNGDIFLVDFGLATFYINEIGDHKLQDLQENITGTPKYVSYFNHVGEPISRRDDLISLGYLYLYLHYGKLSWENPIISENTEYPEISIFHPKNQYRKNMKKWDNISTQMNANIYTYLKYCYEIKYEEKPNYYLMKKIFV
jgi:serine/threonine protein kinase